MFAVSLFAGCGLAQDVIPTAGSRSLGMAGAQVMLSGPGTGTGNPAALAPVQNLAISMQYVNYYLIPDLGSGAFFADLPTPGGAFGIGLHAFGNPHYHENEACLSYGRKFGNRIRAGIGLHYLQIRQPADFGTLNSLVPALGIQALPIPGFIIGIHAFNPANQQFHPIGYTTLPAVIQAGAGYQFGSDVMICAEVMKRSKEPLIFRGGMEISLKKIFVARFGLFSGEFPGYSFGFGFQLRQLIIDVAALRHPVLGFSPAVTLTFKSESGNKNFRKLAN